MAASTAKPLHEGVGATRSVPPPPAAWHGPQQTAIGSQEPEHDPCAYAQLHVVETTGGSRSVGVSSVEQEARCCFFTSAFDLVLYLKIISCRVEL